MPRKTKAECESELANWAEILLLYSASLNDDADQSEEDDDEFDINFTPEDALELLALEQLVVMESLSGDGSHGPYNDIQKTDNVVSGLLSPEWYFRHFR
jgi:hypothetical protein